MPKRTPIKKTTDHTNTNASSRRHRITHEIRKEKRQSSFQSKRRRILSTEIQTSSANQSIPPQNINEILKTIQETAFNSSNISHEELLSALKELKLILASNEQNYEMMDEIIESGIILTLVNVINEATTLSIATRSGGEIYSEILWCLATIASGQYEHTKLVLPALPQLLQFLDSSTSSLAEHSAWVLGNIAGDCDEFRHILIANDIISVLLRQLQKKEGDLRKTSAWALSNVARGHSISASPFIEAGVLPVIFSGLQKQIYTIPVVVEIAWLLSFLSAKEDEALQIMLENGLCQALAPYFQSEDDVLVTPVLRVFGNVCSRAPDHHTDDWQLPYALDLVRDGTFIQRLLMFLLPDNVSEHVHLAAESAWVIANLATLDDSIVKMLIQQQVLPLLVSHLIQSTSTFELRNESAFALTNIATTSPEHMKQILQQEQDRTLLLKKFLNLLTAADLALIGNSLKFLEYTLRYTDNGVAWIEALDGINALESVQYECDDSSLSQWAEGLVNEFYGENYGVSSPVNNIANMTFSFPNAETVDPSTGPGGRGRGMHMTGPSWKK